MSQPLRPLLVFTEKEALRIGELIDGIDILEIAKREDMAYLRDPNDVSMLLCYNYKIARLLILKQARFGNRKPQKVVMFGFVDRAEIYKTVVRVNSTRRSSVDYQDICYSDFRAEMQRVRTLIHSYS